MKPYQRPMAIKAHCHLVTLVPTRTIEVRYKASILRGRKGFKERLNA